MLIDRPFDIVDVITIVKMDFLHMFIHGLFPGLLRSHP